MGGRTGSISIMSGGRRGVPQGPLSWLVPTGVPASRRGGLALGQATDAPRGTEEGLVTADVLLDGKGTAAPPPRSGWPAPQPCPGGNSRRSHQMNRSQFQRTEKNQIGLGAGPASQALGCRKVSPHSKGQSTAHTSPCQRRTTCQQANLTAGPGFCPGPLPW